MFLSMHNWMRAEPIETTIWRLSKFGFESIEFSGEPEKYDTKEVLRLLKENKVNCWGSVTLMFEGRDLIHASPQVRENSVKYIKGIVTMVHEMEGRIVTIVPSQVGKVVPMASPEEEWQWAVEGLREIYATASRWALPSPSSRSTVSRPTSSTATIRLCCLQRNPARTVALPSMLSTSILKKPTSSRQSPRRPAFGGLPRR